MILGPTSATFGPPIERRPPRRAGGAGLRTSGGGLIAGDHWAGPLNGADHSALERAVAPVLDVGCGPGRHAHELAARGLPSLAIDIAPSAVASARRRGVAALQRCVFDRLPGAGRWGTVLLLDGNLGIGADPTLLLRRAATLVRPGGKILVEVAATGAPGAPGAPTAARLDLDGTLGPWFGWVEVTADDLGELAVRAAVSLVEQWSDDGRSFACLTTAGR